MSITVKIVDPPRHFYKKISQETGLSVSTIRNVLKGRNASRKTKLMVIEKSVEILKDPS